MSDLLDTIHSYFRIKAHIILIIIILLVCKLSENVLVESIFILVISFSYLVIRLFSSKYKD